MLIEGMVGQQSSNERGRSNIAATAINHGHLVLKITDIAFEGLSWLHLDGEEVIDVLKLLPRGVLIEEGITKFLEALERS